MGRDDDDGDGALGAAWGGGGDDVSGGDDPGPGDGDDAGAGPPPRPEDVEAGGPGERPEPPGGERATVDRITALLQAHKTAFTVALFGYAFLVFPWLNNNGFRAVGIAIGVGFLGGIVLVTVANAQDARENIAGTDDERRGF